mgnify:CR=1 FL=1
MLEITTNEVSTDELTLKPNKSENAVEFLSYWSQWLAAIIDIIKGFFDRIAEAFNSAE